MRKNVIIALQSLVILVLAIPVVRDVRRHTPRQSSRTNSFATPTDPTVTIVHFPDISLDPNERITHAELQFEHAIIRTIRNIPPQWYANIDLDPPPNPTFKGRIEVGAAAVGSASELPEFEIERYVQELEPRATRAVFTVEAYADDGKERIIQIELKKP